MAVAELRARRDAVCRRVESLRQYVWRARAERGFDEALEDVRLAEDEMRHAIIRDVSPEVRAQIELQLGDGGFARIEPSVHRVATDEPALCHIIGKLGEVSARQLEADPFREDEFRRYAPGDLVGVSGVEACAETALRGGRGERLRDLDGRVLSQTDASDGQDVPLSIDVDLQVKIAALLTDAVAANPPSTGAACVVLDVRTREVLALVSVPTFDPRTLATDYRTLRDDARARPLLFRAVAEEYPPGSICKPLALLAGMATGGIDPRQTVECRGRLFDNVDAWFCWTQWRQLPPHGTVDAIGAIQHSCNIYFYQLGQRVGGRRLTDFYRGVFQAARLGLPEERDGNVPTEAELIATRGHGFSPSDGRNFALGQGEIQITPLQAANLFATIAAGELRAPTLIHNDPRPRPALPLPGVRREHWDVLREGLFRCANQPGGTAFEGARMDELVVCGKTGSAQCVPRVVEWEVTFGDDDGARHVVNAHTIESARERLNRRARERPVARRAVARWPALERAERGSMPTHAWFAGFAPREDPRIAVALVIEFGGSGGKVAAPVGRRVFETLLDSPGGYLVQDAALPKAAHPRQPRNSPADVE
ncbi:MAG: penicillin-binding transpeptidase domain-containing protein [Phycisphaerae bacterium]